MMEKWIGVFTVVVLVMIMGLVIILLLYSWDKKKETFRTLFSSSSCKRTFIKDREFPYALTSTALFSVASAFQTEGLFIDHWNRHVPSPFPFRLLEFCKDMNDYYVSIIEEGQEIGYQFRYNVSVDRVVNFQLVGNPRLEEYVMFPVPDGVSDKKIIWSTDYELQKDILVNLLDSKKKFIYDQSYQCVDAPYLPDQLTCESFGKIWDRPCQRNTDCPFYKMNQNYTNDRGKCLSNGMCEFPVNVMPRGFRRFEPSSQPYCYNCTGSPSLSYTCCEDQKKKSLPEYELMESPDYVFPNDVEDRYYAKDVLRSRGLDVHYPM